MPWTQPQMRVIQARAHGWRGSGAFEVSQNKAQQMAKEGTRRPSPQQSALAKAVRGR